MHPDGYHKSEYAKSACYACSHPEKLVVSPEHEELARRLVREGYVSTSRKYLQVQRTDVPEMHNLVTFLPDAPEWQRAVLRELWQLHVFASRRRWLVPGTEMTLTPAEFRAFKQAGGESA